MNTIPELILQRLRAERFVEFSSMIPEATTKELNEVRANIEKEMSGVPLVGYKNIYAYKVLKIGRAIVAQEYAARTRSQEKNEAQKITTPLSHKEGEPT